MIGRMGRGSRKDMLTAYTAGGAPVRLQLLAPFDTDGLDLIYNAPFETWLPASKSSRLN